MTRSVSAEQRLTVSLSMPLLTVLIILVNMKISPLRIVWPGNGTILRIGTGSTGFGMNQVMMQEVLVHSASGIR